MTKRIPKQARSREKYDEIIRTTGRIIRDEPFAQVTTHKIARKAGVGIGTLYEYFDNKEDILLALLDYEARIIWHRVEERIPEWLAGNTIQALESFAEMAVDVAIENRGITKVLVGQVPGLMDEEPIVRLLGKAEMLVKLLFASDDRFAGHSMSDTNMFIFMNSLIGLLLGIANGLPPTVSRESVATQISKAFQLLMENQAFLGEPE